ncbi:MAG: hypothetical protein J6B75_07040 [Ruminococcus sp.]|nr:hypothetical protein [Ruminococcus sp.]
MKKHKLLIALAAIAILAGFFAFLKAYAKDEKAITEDLNETYYEYAENPENFTVTDAKIIEAYSPDLGTEINFFPETREWIVEVRLNDELTAKTTVLRDKGEKVGDVIKIAYKNNSELEVLAEYMDSTQLRFIKSEPIIKTINLLYALDLIAIVADVGFIIYLSFKKKN